jgi:hypothetical protein
MSANYPNWPKKVSYDEGLVKIAKQVVVTEPVKISTPLNIVSQPTTIQEAKANGAVEGTILAAPLAPSSGTIQGEAESLVTVTLKNFFDTPTWKAVKKVFQAAGLIMFLTFGNALLNVWTADKSIFDKGAIDWRATEKVAELAAGPVLMGGLMMLMKKKDNNPSK